MKTKKVILQEQNFHSDKIRESINMCEELLVAMKNNMGNYTKIEQLSRRLQDVTQDIAHASTWNRAYDVVRRSMEGETKISGTFSIGKIHPEKSRDTISLKKSNEKTECTCGGNSAFRPFCPTCR